MTETTEQYRTRINQLNASIKSEPYIEKMRNDIAEGVSKTGNRQADIEDKFQNVIDETTGKDFTSAPEIIAARKDKPNLNARLDSFEQSTTAQFQQKANKTDVRENTFTKPINVSEMDTETKALFTGGAVAVVGENAVGRENLKRKAVGYSKQEVISIDEEKSVKYKTSSDGTYKKEWINYSIPSWSSTLTERSTINPIKKNAEITVKTTGVHDRFTIFTSKYETFSDLDKNFKEIFIKGENGESTGDETYTFTNVDDDFIIVGITSTIQKPKVVIEEFFNDKAFEEIKAIKKNVGIDSTPMRNIVENGDFSKGNESWEEVKGNLTIGTNEGIFLANDRNGSAFQNLSRKEGDIFYFRSEVKSQSSSTGISINDSLIEDLTHSGSGFYETLSTRFTNLSASKLWKYGIIDKNTTGYIEIRFKKMVVINLTEDFGKGNEPSKKKIDDIFDKYIENNYFDGTIINYINLNKILTDLSDKTNSSASNNGWGITKTKEVMPVMFGVKMSNERDKSRGYSETPRPVGWLYYQPETYDILYAVGRPENIKFLCEWNSEITWNGTSKPEHYRPFITKDGDIIFVWRGDLQGLGVDTPDTRQNPIIYPSGDWNNPIVVDLGGGTKPTSWLQNCGADFLYNQNVFLFAEYTRPHHKTTNVWRVTKPFTDPANWNIVKSFELSGNNQTGMKHCHTINYDTFSGLVYLTTGDDDAASKIYSSSDYGITWDLVLEGQRKYSRVLNFVFTKDKVYWSNDDSLHGFYSVDRGIDDVPNFSDITDLADLAGNPPTYVNCLIDNPNGILMLHRFDGASAGPLNVHFWDIETSTLHVLEELYPTDNEAKLFGFRVEAANFYQSKGSNETVVGFGNPKNDIGVLGNTTYGLNKDRINNLVLKVVKNGSTFNLEMKSVVDSSY